MIFTILAKTVFSADGNGEPLADDLSLPDLAPGEYGAAFAKMFLTLIVLIALMAATYWFLRRLIQAKTTRNSAHAMIQVLEKRMISQKSILYLVEVEGQKILLAESQHEIRRLQNWPHPTEPQIQELTE